MPLVVAVQVGTRFRTALRRGLRGRLRVRACDSVARAETLIGRELVDAILVDVRAVAPQPVFAKTSAVRITRTQASSCQPPTE